MKKILFVIIIIVFFVVQTIAQNKTIKQNKTRQETTYYPDGKVNTIEDFLADSCTLVINSYERIKVDTCRYGYFKEYHPNGILKTLGQYDCKLPNVNTLLPFNFDRSFECEHEEYENDCFKTGIWYRFDTLGGLISNTRYNCGWEGITVQYNLKQDTLVAKGDSTIFKIKEYRYGAGKSYLIKRTINNHCLLLDFFKVSYWHYWYVSDKRYDFLMEEKTSISKKLENDNMMVFKYYDRDFGKQVNNKGDIYVNLSTLKNGRYYIYNNHFYGWDIYEIILQDN